MGEAGSRRLSPPVTTTAAFVTLFVLQVATIAPGLAPSAVYLPQALYAFAGPLYISLLAAGLAFILLALLRALRSAVPSAHGVRHAATAMLTLVLVILASAGAYYSRFGNYPTTVLARDFMAAPSAFLAYTLSDVSLADGFVAIAGAGVLLVLSAVATKLIWQNSGSMRGSATMLGAGALLMWGTHAIPTKNVNRQHAFLIAEHSLPAAKYLIQSFSSRTGNGVESARPYIPRVESSPPGDAKRLPRARHVLLVIAEALRADHLMAYGYQRHTMPFLESKEADWLVFRRAYSHGSRTADSFPVIFNSRYFAAVDHTSTGAAALWSGLRSGGVRSGFISAGALEWSGVTRAIDFESIDVRMIASDFSKELRLEVSPLPFDYAVDDSRVVSKYIELIASTTRDQPSFVTLHLVGSHYPFHYEDTPDAFLPSLRQPAGTSMGERLRVQSYDSDADVTTTRLEELRNSYDNSLRHIDHVLQQAVESLEQAGIADDSVVMFTSDHGESLGEHQTLFHGTTLYEEQVHVPLLMRVGKNVRELAAPLAARSDHVVGQVDLIPTVYQLLLGGEAAPRAFEGRSLLGSHVKPYELLLFRGIGEKLGIVSDHEKYLFDVIGKRGEEYQLSDDPGERRDRWYADEDSTTAFLGEVRRRNPSWFSP